MSLETLMEAVDNAEAPRGSHWVKYRDAYRSLCDKGFKKHAACKFIGDHEGLNDKEVEQLYSSARAWDFHSKGGKS